MGVCVCSCMQCTYTYVRIYPYFGMNVDLETVQCIFTHSVSIIFIFKINIVDFVLAQIIISKRLCIPISFNYDLSQKGISCFSNKRQMLNLREQGVEGDALRKMRGYFLLADRTTRLNRCSMKWNKLKKQSVT